MKKGTILLILIVVLIAVGIFVRGVYFRAKTQSADTVKPGFTMTVEKGEMKKTVSASGNLQSVKEKNLFFHQAGKVEKINVKEGERVKAGKVLAELDKTQQELNYLKAKNAYDSAKINGSPSQILEQELNLKIAEDNLNKTVLEAPFDGLITKINVEKGDYVSTGQEVIRIIDGEAYQIEINVDESECHQIKVGQPVIITIEAIPGQKFKGEVSEIGYETENTNGVVTVPVKVILTGISPQLKPGFSADLDIIVETVKDKIIIPVTAVFNDRGVEKVMKIIDEKPVATPVKTGLSNGLMVVIEEGLKEGDRIMINTFNQAGLDGEENMRMMMGGRGMPAAGLRGGR